MVHCKNGSPFVLNYQTIFTNLSNFHSLSVCLLNFVLLWIIRNVGKTALTSMLTLNSMRSQSHVKKCFVNEKIK